MNQSPASSKASELQAVVEEAAACLESAAAHNRSKGRTVLAHAQQDRADRLRIALAAEAPDAEAAPVASAEPDRKIVLLRAAHELLRRQHKSSEVLNLLSETVFYDDAECDGRCLLDDIEIVLNDEADSVAQATPAPEAAPVAPDALPPLPEAYQEAGEDAGCWFPDLFTGSQMQDYARAALSSQHQNNQGESNG